MVGRWTGSQKLQAMMKANNYNLRCNSRTSLRKSERFHTNLRRDIFNQSSRRRFRDFEINPLGNVSETLYEMSQRCIWNAFMSLGYVSAWKFFVAISYLYKNIRTVWYFLQKNITSPDLLKSNLVKLVWNFPSSFFFNETLRKAITLLLFLMIHELRGKQTQVIFKWGRDMFQMKLFLNFPLMTILWMWHFSLQVIRISDTNLNLSIASEVEG